MLGLLWMDDSDLPTARKIEDAARRYRLRFGVAPTLCLVNPADMAEGLAQQGLGVEPRRNIPRHHFLVGRAAVEEAVALDKAA